MPKQLYTAKGIQINDSWYIRHNGRYYAYYLQYQNRRADYVEGWFDLIHWRKAQRRYEERKQ